MDVRWRINLLFQAGLSVPLQFLHHDHDQRGTTAGLRLACNQVHQRTCPSHTLTDVPEAWSHDGPRSCLMDPELLATGLCTHNRIRPHGEPCSELLVHFLGLHTHAGTLVALPIWPDCLASCMHSLSCQSNIRPACVSGQIPVRPGVGLCGNTSNRLLRLVANRKACPVRSAGSICEGMCCFPLCEQKTTVNVCSAAANQISICT